MLNAVLGLILLCVIVGCGVRGDPIPPGYPAELGRGRPVFKDPSQSMGYPPLPTAEELDEKLEKEEEED